MQYNISNPKFSAILDSEIIITTGGEYYRYNALQLAINGKMYIAQSDNSLSVINDPNIAELNCNFQNNTVNFEQTYNSSIGLPNLIQDYYHYEINFQNLCHGIATEFEILSHVDIASASSNFGDAASGANNTSTQLSPSHLYSNPGDYIVNVDIITAPGAQIHLTDS